MQFCVKMTFVVERKGKEGGGARGGPPAGG